MGKSFVYKWPVTKLSDESKAFAKTIIENFKDLQVFLNTYGVARDDDGETVSLTNLNLVESLFVGTGVAHAGGPEFSEMYLDNAQVIAGSTWEQVEVDAVLGSSGTPFTENTGTHDISTSKAGIFLAVGQIEYNAAESGYARIVVEGVERARAAYTTRTGTQVVFLGRADDDDTFSLEVFNDSAGQLNAGSQATFLRVVRLFSLA